MKKDHGPERERGEREREMEPCEKKIEKFLNSKYFRNKKFWIVDLVRYKRPVEKKRIEEYRSRLTKNCRIVMGSNVLHNLFKTSRGPWDEIFIVEYVNARDYVSRLGRGDYSSVFEAREIIAVSDPNFIREKMDFSNFKRTLEESWNERRHNHFEDDMNQDIEPDLESLTRMFSDKSKGWKRGKERPLWAINLLRFFRNNVDGRTTYYKYGQIAQNVITSGTVKKKALKGDGPIVAPSVAMTLLGPIEWDEFVVMGYANLKSFMGLQRNKAWQKAEETYRKKGLLKQGLLMVSPPSSRRDGVSHL